LWSLKLATSSIFGKGYQRARRILEEKRSI
jgi:hypothetical protein